MKEGVYVKQGMLLLAACALLLAPISLWAQGYTEPSGRGWGAAANDERMYEPARTETIRGEVVDVLYPASPSATGRGVHVRLRTDQGTIPVHLGPEWYVSQQDLDLQPGDRVSVTGSLVMYEGAPAMIAAAVQKGDELFEFRDDLGFPRWSASRRGLRLGREGWGRPSVTGSMRIYDPASTETIRGRVRDLGIHAPRYTVGWGRHLTLETPEEMITVHLGPEWFLERQTMQIEPDDVITVFGSRVMYEGRDILIAAEVRRGNEILELRDARGQPRWSASRRMGRWDRMQDGRRGRGDLEARRVWGMPDAWDERDVRGWGWNSEVARMYDPHSVVTLEGEVVDIFAVVPQGASGRGIHLRLRTRSGDIVAHLGPEWYLENQEFAIEPGDRISITGSLVNYQGQEAIVAAMVVDGDDVLELRDERGFPRWAGWRRINSGR